MCACADAMRIRALSALLAAHDGMHTDSRLMLVFCTTAGDDGKSEVIGFLHMRGVVSVDWAMDNCVVSGGAEN